MFFEFGFEVVSKRFQFSCEVVWFGSGLVPHCVKRSHLRFDAFALWYVDYHSEASPRRLWAIFTFIIRSPVQVLAIGTGVASARFARAIRCIVVQTLACQYQRYTTILRALIPTLTPSNEHVILAYYSHNSSINSSMSIMSFWHLQVLAVL